MSDSFSYQAHLLQSGEPANGFYDLRVVIYDAEIGGNQLGTIITNQFVLVENGLLNTTLDLGSELLTGQELWLDISIRDSERPLGFTPLAPRQPLLAIPYATYATTAQAASHATSSDSASHALSADQATYATTAQSASHADSSDSASHALSADQATAALTANEATRAAVADVANEVVSADWSTLFNLPEGFADQIDDDTTYSAGPGLDLIDGSFSLAAQSVGTGELADASITSEKIIDGAVTARHLADQSVNSTKIDTESALAGHSLVFDGTTLSWTNTSWLDLSEVPAPFSDGVDDNTEYTAGPGLVLEDTQFALDPIGLGSDFLAEGSVTEAKLATNAVATVHLQRASVTPDKVAPLLAEPGQALLFDGAGVIWTNVDWASLARIPEGFLDAVDNDTVYQVGDGLRLEDSLISLEFGGSGTNLNAARSDHQHDLNLLEGVLSDTQLSTNVALLNEDLVFAGSNLFQGPVLLDNPTNWLVGTFVGDGTGLTNLQGSLLDPGTVETSALADNAITSIKLAEAAVGALQLQTNAVTTDAILDGTITDLDLADGSVTSQKLTGDSVGSATVQDDSLLPQDLDLAAFDPIFWRTDGNTGTVAGLHFLGTLDNEPLDLGVYGVRAVRISPNNTNGVNWIAGSSGNHIAQAVVGATISGGGYLDYLGTPHTNHIGGDFSTIAGGSRNRIEETAQWSSISGGMDNRVGINAQWSIVSGGQNNEIGRDADFTVVAGGRNNFIMPTSTASVIGGGTGNLIQTNAIDSVVSGGSHNQISISSLSSVIPGGTSNFVSASHAFAAGYRARAEHDGSFIWADATEVDLPTSNTNQFTIRASGGVRVFSDGAASSGVILAPGSGSWSTLSDRASKDNFSKVQPETILEKLVGLPLSKWTYRTESPTIRHLGPIAQEFHAAFGLGDDPRRITTVDADGVALAAIQGLNAKLASAIEAQDREIAELQQQLRQVTATLNQVLLQLNAGESPSTIERN